MTLVLDRRKKAWSRSFLTQAFKQGMLLCVSVTEYVLQCSSSYDSHALCRQEIEKVIRYLPPKTGRQNVMFSATYPPNIQELANIALRPQRQLVDTVGEEQTHATEQVCLRLGCDLQSKHSLMISGHNGRRPKACSTKPIGLSGTHRRAICLKSPRRGPGFVHPASSQEIACLV